jgi:hypothetical protein
MNISSALKTPESQSSFCSMATQQHAHFQGNEAFVPPTIIENQQFNRPRNASAELRIRAQLPASVMVPDVYRQEIKRIFPHLQDDALHDRHVSFYTMRQIMLNHGLRHDSPFLNNEYIHKFFYPALQVEERSPQRFYYAPHDTTLLPLVGEDFLIERFGPLLGSPLPSTVPHSSRDAYLQLYLALADEMRKEPFSNKYAGLLNCAQFLEQRLNRIIHEHLPSNFSNHPQFLLQQK